MKRNVLAIGIVFLLLASACGPRSAPTANPVDVQGTAQAAAFTMIAQTQAAIPSATPNPPTDTPAATSLPTDTPPPLPTLSIEGTVGAPTAGVALPTAFPTFTAQPQQPSSSSSGNQDVCNQPLTAWQGPTATFTILNQTKPEGTIVLSMYVVTPFGQCGYLVVTGDSFSGPIGDYSAGAFITGKQNLKAFGGFRITEGSWKIVVRNDSITAQGGCSPNC